MVKKIAIGFLSVGISFCVLGALAFGLLASHYQEVGLRTYLALLYVVFVGYVSLPIVVVGIFLWLYAKSSKLKILAFLIPVLLIAFFMPFPSKCTIRGGDVELCKAIFPYRWEYWQYSWRSLNDINFRKEAKWASWGKVLYFQEGCGDVLSAIRRTRVSGEKQYCSYSFC